MVSEGYPQKKWVVVVTLSLAALVSCTSTEKTMDVAKLKELGTKYTAAWCRQNAASVAAFFGERGSLTINGPGRNRQVGARQRMDVRK